MVIQIIESPRGLRDVKEIRLRLGLDRALDFIEALESFRDLLLAQLSQGHLLHVQFQTCHRILQTTIYLSLMPKMIRMEFKGKYKVSSP